MFDNDPDRKPPAAAAAPAPTVVTVSQARRRLADLLSRAEFRGERIEVTRRGRVVAVIAPPERNAA